MEYVCYNDKVPNIWKASWELLIQLFSISFELVCYKTCSKNIISCPKEYFQSIKSSIRGSEF